MLVWWLSIVSEEDCVLWTACCVIIHGFSGGSANPVWKRRVMCSGWGVGAPFLWYHQRMLFGVVHRLLPWVCEGGRPRNWWEQWGSVSTIYFCHCLQPQVLSAGCRTTKGSPSQCSCNAHKLSIQQLTGHARIVHSDDLSHPSQLGLDE